MLPVVFYRSGTCSLSFREGHTLRVFEKRMMRIFDQEGEIPGEFRN
jgi:hypothetical protein